MIRQNLRLISCARGPTIKIQFGLGTFAALLFVCMVFPLPVSGQDFQPQSRLDQVPVMEPRPALSDLERQNLTQRPADDQDSVAGLLSSLQGQDSVFEVVVGRSKLLTLNEPLASFENESIPVVATGDPTVIDFDILPNSQMIRVLGRRVGMTDLSVITRNGQAYTFQVKVSYDINVLTAFIKQRFPHSNIRIGQLYEHLIVEGEASGVQQSAQIIQLIESFANSAQVPSNVESTQVGQPNLPNAGNPDNAQPNVDPSTIPALGTPGVRPNVTATFRQPRIINLIQVPGVQQVMLQVRIAELNRTAFRQIGSSILYGDSSGRRFGSSLGSSAPLAGDAGSLLGLALGGNSTAFAIIPNATLDVVFDALRRNQVVNVLAEPNLMAMHGQEASFLAGGEFPVPVPQNIGGGASTFTVEFREFGVLLDFVPYIMDNGAIRLHVAPEVSTIDQSIGVINQGISIPGVNTRRANTTVELHQGQTLALAGLIQAELEAATDQLPGLGGLPYIGPFFSNTSHERVEKELIILVTPYLVDPMDCQQVGELPGSDVRDPDDHEFYLLNRIESRHPGVNYRATNGWDDPLNIRQLKLQSSGQFYGPYGYSK